MFIAFSGAQGTGKTTLLDIMEKCFTFPEQFNFKFVRNFTRNLAKKGYVINENGTDETQLAIMSAHKDLAYKGGDIIMDRCALDGLVYSHYLWQQGKVTTNTFFQCSSIFKECINKYDIIYYLTPEFPITGDEYRSDKVEYQKAIASVFEDIISVYKVPVIRLTGTVGDRLSTIQKTFGGKIQC